MEHLNSRFRILVDAIHRGHSPDEIKALGKVLAVTALRIAKENSKESIWTLIGSFSGRMPMIRKYAWMIKLKTISLSKSYKSSLAIAKKDKIDVATIYQADLKSIQKNIMLMAKILDVTLKEIKFEQQEIVS